MAKQLVVDLYGCGSILNDMDAIKSAAHEAIDYVGATIVEECCHQFEPIGITYFAVISTSHFSVHTWPEYGYAAIDVFTCTDAVAEGITAKLQELFGAKEVKTQLFERKIN
ncbi:MAG: adenosylmethionine decarboxylase [Lachnospiraceae bacterium]|nr:adenosylmethionine decarboxylase [Lachnospiraceae bacterium]